jgi:hypothetical protein
MVRATQERHYIAREIDMFASSASSAPGGSSRDNAASDQCSECRFCCSQLMNTVVAGAIHRTGKALVMPHCAEWTRRQRGSSWFQKASR